MQALIARQARAIFVKQFYLNQTLRLLDRHKKGKYTSFDKKMYDQVMLVHKRHRLEDVQDELMHLEMRLNKLKSIKTERDLMIRG